MEAPRELVLRFEARASVPGRPTRFAARGPFFDSKPNWAVRFLGRDAPGELVPRFEAKIDGLIERMLKRRGRRRRFFRWGSFSDEHDFGKLRQVAVFFLGVMQWFERPSMAPLDGGDAPGDPFHLLVVEILVEGAREQVARV